MLGISLSELCKWVSKKWSRIEKSWNVKWYGKCGRKVGWIVKRFGKYRRKVIWIVKRFRKYRRKLWNDMENMDKMWNDRENMEKMWNDMENMKKSKLNSEKIAKIWTKPVSRAAAAATTTSTTSTTTAAATRLLENPVEATTIVQNFVLLLVENVVWKKNIRNNKTDIKRNKKIIKQDFKNVNKVYCLVICIYITSILRFEILCKSYYLLLYKVNRIAFKEA